MQNRPFHKNPLLIAVIAILVLGGIGGTIGLVYHFSKSKSNNFIPGNITEDGNKVERGDDKAAGNKNFKKIRSESGNKGGFEIKDKTPFKSESNIKDQGEREASGNGDSNAKDDLVEPESKEKEEDVAIDKGNTKIDIFFKKDVDEKDQGEREASGNGGTSAKDDLVEPESKEKEEDVAIDKGDTKVDISSNEYVEEDLRFINAKKELAISVDAQESPENKIYFAALVDSGTIVTNEALLKFQRDYLKIENIQNPKPKDLLDLLGNYFQVALETSSAPPKPSYYTNLRRDLAMSSLEMVKAHKAFLVLKEKLDGSQHLSSYKDKFVEIITYSLEPPPYFHISDCFHWLLGKLSLLSSLQELNEFTKDHLKSLLEHLLQAEEIRLGFTFLRNEGLMQNIKRLRVAIRNCKIWSHLVILFLNIPEPEDNTSERFMCLHKAKDYFFQIFGSGGTPNFLMGTTKFINYCFENNLTRELGLLEDYYKLGEPKGYNFFKYYVGISKISKEFPPSELKEETLTLIRKMEQTNYYPASFDISEPFRLIRSFVKTYCEIPPDQIEMMCQTLDDLIKAQTHPFFKAPPRLLKFFLGLIRDYKDSIKIATFVDHLAELQKVPTPSPHLLIPKLELLFENIPGEISSSLLISLAKIYKSLDCDQDGYENFGEACKLYLQFLHFPPKEKMVEMKNKLADKDRDVLEDLDLNNYKEIKEAIYSQRIPNDPTSEAFRYLVNRRGIMIFESSTHYHQAFFDYIKLPLAFELNLRCKRHKQALEDLLMKLKLEKPNLNKLKRKSIVQFLIDHEIAGSKLDLALFEAFMNYLVSDAIFYQNPYYYNDLSYCVSVRYLAHHLAPDPNFIIDLIRAIIRIEATKESSKIDKYNVDRLDKIDDNELAYRIWHVSLKPKVLNEAPTQNFLKENLYYLLDYLLKQLVRYRISEEIVSASAPYFPNFQDLKELLI